MVEMTFGQMRDEAKKQGFEPLPIDTYNFKVERADIKPGSGGNSQISTKIVVTDGPLAGRTTLNRLVFYKNDGEVNGMVYRQLKALGIADDHPVWAQIDAVGLEQGIGSLAQLIVGAVFVGEITHQVWNGEIRDNVQNMKPYGSGGMVPTGPTGVAGAVPTAPVAPVAAPVAPVPPAPAPLAPVAPVPPATVPVQEAAPTQPPTQQPPPVAAVPAQAPVVQPVAPVPMEPVTAEQVAPPTAVPAVVPVPPTPPEEEPF